VGIVYRAARPDELPATQQHIVRQHLHLAAESGAAPLSAFIPGSSEAVRTVAAGQGMRITFPMVLMSSDAFGGWSRYLPRNPGFM
jgi:hypothetical protein